MKLLSHFIWLILLISITSFVTYFYENNKKSQYVNLKKTLNNLYFQKSIAKITSGLEDRFSEFEYIVKEGDSYESIINSLKIPRYEKQIFLETVKKNKQIRILRPSQKINFKIDKKNDPKILEFIVEISKKKEFYFLRELKGNKFNSKLLEKDFRKILAYKESKITSSLYKAATNLDIKPNIIIEFAR